MRKIKTEQEAYAPADDVQVEIEDGYIEKRPAYRQRGVVSFANTDETPQDRAKLLAMFEYVTRNIKEKDEEENEKPAKKGLPERRKRLKGNKLQVVIPQKFAMIANPPSPVRIRPAPPCGGMS